MDNKKYTCEDVQEIVRILRGENGCPWDRAQTFHSLRQHLLEEANEYISAVRIYEESGSAENMREELGDLLFQIMINSRIAEEEGLFTYSEVAEEICKKMIRRHPHIFGQQDGENDDGSDQSWEAIKKREKENKSWITSPLREIPPEHPALTRAAKVLKKVDQLYEPCADEKETLKALSQKIDALQQETESERHKESACVKSGMAEMSQETRTAILGDLLLDICNLGRIWGVPLELALQDRVESLIREQENAEKVSICVKKD